MSRLLDYRIGRGDPMSTFWNHRFNIRLWGITLGFLTISVSFGCGLNYVGNDRETGLPSTLVVTGWTNDGCIENLYDRADDLAFKVNLLEVTRAYEGFGAIPMPSPFWPIYTCTAQIVPFEVP